MRGLYEYFDGAAKELEAPPAVLNELADKVNMHKRVSAEKETTAARFAPVKAKFALLEKFERKPTDGESADLARLPEAWAAFQDMLGKTEVSLDDAKDGFRDKLNRMVASLITEVEEHHAAFAEKAPKAVERAVTRGALAAATATLDETAREISSFRARETDLVPGMEIFGVPHPPLRELMSVE